MFKRRRHDEPHLVVPPSVAPARPIGPTQPFNPGTLTVPRSPPSGSADTGLGVPPFRPAPPKEAPNMARSPFAPTPIPGGPTAPVATAGATPAPANGSRPASLPSAAPRPTREGAERRTLVVGRGISVQGTVQDAERLVVEGTVEATMIHATELAISHGGVFKGEVEVEDAEIAGTIDGTLTARASLVVRETGRVLGTARCKRLQVEDGGQITGQMEMLTEGGPARFEPVRTALTEPAAG